MQSYIFMVPDGAAYCWVLFERDWFDGAMSLAAPFEGFVTFWAVSIFSVKITQNYLYVDILTTECNYIIK